jgi:iron complex transport system substrate-binding protein
MVLHMSRGLILSAALAPLLAVHLAGCGVPDGSQRTADAQPGDTSPARRIVTDMRGVRVTLPSRITRVATIDDGFVESVMARLGVIREVVVTGSWSLKRSYDYRFPTEDGREQTYRRGMSPVVYLHPWLTSVPCAGSEESDAINYEALAQADPDVVIMRAGDCTVGTAPEVLARTTTTLKSLGIPLVVLMAPSAFASADLASMTEEMRVLGQLFDKEEEALAFADELRATEALIRERTRGVQDATRPTALYLGLSAGARQAGGAGLVWGTDTAESHMLEEVVGARNVYRGRGFQARLSAEHLLALDPDVIFLPTAAGYHPPRELYEAPYYRLLRDLKAIRHRRVYALPWSPMNCARRVEYPIDLMIMAKGAYPDRFRDIAVHAWVLGFYRRTYRVDQPTALGLRSAQWLDWTVEEGF